ncbi:hypothetical protein CRENBAI_021331 [Crenichthys baileyi]|uniref:Uncharacterized protein n=1 Tax=Crenichthys baileyi TaxID=28760 RepID=A0AAV9QZM5_9TELE
MYSSPELVERISQMERYYERAAHARFPERCCRGQVSRALLQSSPRQVSRELLQSSPRQVSRALLQSSPRQVSRALLQSSQRQVSRALLQSSPRQDHSLTHHSLTLSLPQPPPQVTEGLGDASASAHLTEGLGDASASAHVTEGLGDASASVHATESFVLVLASDPRDEGFEEEAPPDLVPEEFKDHFVLVLASETRAEGSPGSASASEGLPGIASASEGSPGIASASEGSPGIASASEGSPGAASASEGSHDAASASEGLPGLRRWPPGSLRLCRSPGPRRRHRLIRVLSSGSWTRPELYARTGRPPGRLPELCFCFWPSYRGPHRLPWAQSVITLTHLVISC